MREDQKFAIPSLVVKSLNYLLKHGLDVEFICEKEGVYNDIQNYKQIIDSDDDINFSNCNNPHTVFSLLKLYLSELPEPLISFYLYEEFLNLTNSHYIDPNECKKLLNKLPKENQALLYHLLYFFDIVSKRSFKNHMTAEKLAVVFGPLILRPNQFYDNIKIFQLTTYLIQNPNLLKTRDFEFQDSYLYELEAKYDYKAQNSDELSFTIGDRIMVLLEDESGWWKGLNISTQLVGYFPRDYFKFPNDEESDEEKTKENLLNEQISLSSVSLKNTHKEKNLDIKSEVIEKRERSKSQPIIITSFVENIQKDFENLKDILNGNQFEKKQSINSILFTIEDKIMKMNQQFLNIQQENKFLLKQIEILKKKQLET
jgi:hypothetical protein